MPQSKGCTSPGSPLSSIGQAPVKTSWRLLLLKQTFQESNSFNLFLFLCFSDVHTFQRRSGCAWDDVTGLSKGFDEYGYDGENFISLDLNQMRYVPHTAQANMTAERWNRDGALIQSQSSYHTRECVNWLKRFGKTNLEQTGAVEVRHACASTLRCAVPVKIYIFSHFRIIFNPLKQ